MAATDAMKRPPAVDAPGVDVTIGMDPHRVGPAFARLSAFGRPVWAIIAHLQGVDWDVAETARSYAVPEEAVRAAIAHYEADPRPIDAWLLLNRAAFDS